MLVQTSLGEIVVFAIASGLFFALLLFGVVPRLMRNEHLADWPLRLFVTIVSTLMSVGWLAMTLALLGRYTLGWVALLLLGVNIVLAVFSIRERNIKSEWKRGDWYEVGLLALLLIAGAFYLRPHEYVLGGSDAGSYINTAAATARTGSYLQTSEWNRFLSEHADVTLRTQPSPMLTQHLQFVGWYIDDNEPSLSRPQFFPFHPVLLSVAMSVGGVAAGLFVTPLAGILNIAALYFLARQLFGKPVALLSALLLTITSTQLFFARYPTTEPLTMLLLFSGFLAFQIMRDSSKPAPAWGVFGGAAFGMAMLTRIDLPLVLAMILLALALRGWQRQWSPAWSAFALTLLFFFIQLVVTVWLFTWPYFWNTYLSVFSLVTRAPWLAGGLAIGVIGLLIVIAILGPERFGAQILRLEASIKARWTLAVAIILISAYAYFLRPILEPARSYVTWPGGDLVPILNGQNWVRLGWYLTPLGIGLATAGLAMILVRERLTRLTIVVGIGVLTIFQYVYNILNTPYHIYAMRRYVPIAIPMLLMFAAYAIVALPRFAKPWVTYTLRGVVIVALVGGLLYQDRYVVPARDYAGSLQQIRELQRLLHPQAIVVVAEPVEAFFADTFGIPLQSMFGHPIATVRMGGQPTADNTLPDHEDNQEQVADFLDALLANANAQGRPLQLLAVEAIPQAVRSHLSLQPVGSYPFTTQMLMNTYDDFPSVTQTVHYGIEIYDVVVRDSEQLSSDIIEVDIGSIDAAYLDDGFYGKELIPGAPSMRWTKDVATLTVQLPPDSKDASEQEWEVQVRAMIYRPEGVDPAPVTVYAEDQLLGSFVPTQEWTTFVFQIPGTTISATDYIQIKFATDAFVPAELGVNNDQRPLGFLLDWIKIAPASTLTLEESQ